MNLRAVLRAPTGVDSLRAAGAFGAVAGIASLLQPYFVGLAEALAAIAFVAWLTRTGRGAGRTAVRNWAVAGSVGVAGAFAIVAVPPWSELRGAVVGLSAAALAATTARGPAFGEGEP
jgi:hypothetical protein